MKGVFITGTDTDVGKTYVGAVIAKTLVKNNIQVVPRKPVESGCKLENGILIPHDALMLQQASQTSQSLETICPYRFAEAISPERAARLNNKTLTIEQLADACLKDVDINNDFLLVEGAGGFYSPLCSDGLNADLVVHLNLPIILVVENRVGCINQALLSIDAIKKRNAIIYALILNQTTELNKDVSKYNYEDLTNLTDISIFRIGKNSDNLDNSLLTDIINFAY